VCEHKPVRTLGRNPNEPTVVVSLGCFYLHAAARQWQIAPAVTAEAQRDIKSNTRQLAHRALTNLP
jgi:hypothetical protein